MYDQLLYHVCMLWHTFTMKVQNAWACHRQPVKKENETLIIFLRRKKIIVK